jgi:ribosomal protein L10
MTSNLRRACFKAGIKLEVVKNTCLQKAMEASDNDYGDLPSVLTGNSATFRLLTLLEKSSKISEKNLQNLF